MSKRKPGSDLNHENWDQHEDSEEAGVFEKADRTSLEHRTIIRGRRRIAKPASSTNPFANFTGFDTTCSGQSGLRFAKFSFAVPPSSKTVTAEIGIPAPSRENISVEQTETVGDTTLAPALSSSTRVFDGVTVIEGIPHQVDMDQSHAGVKYAADKNDNPPKLYQHDGDKCPKDISEHRLKVPNDTAANPEQMAAEDEADGVPEGTDDDANAAG